MFNEATLIGNVGKDPEIKTTQKGTKFATFRIATSEKWTDKATGEKKEESQWHNVVVWNENLVLIVEQYVKKGNRILVRGQIKYRKWHKDGTPQDDQRDATDIVIQGFTHQIKLLEKAPSNRAPDPSEPTRDYQRPPNGNGASNGSGNGKAYDHDYGDEIPF